MTPRAVQMGTSLHSHSSVDKNVDIFLELETLSESTFCTFYTFLPTGDGESLRLLQGQLQSITLGSLDSFCRAEVDFKIVLGKISW